jgi:cellulose biosynthesis protein BcsQ
VNISVISPHIHGNGNTTVAALLAFELASRNKSVCLTHVTSKSESMFPYFGFEEFDDQTNNPLQLINLIREGGLRKEEIGNYCREVTESLDLFSLDTFISRPGKETNVSETQMQDVLSFICNNFPYDYIVFDIDENDLNKENVKMVLAHTDCLIFVLTQSLTELQRFAAQKTKILKQTGNIPNLVVINKYSDIIGTIKDAASVLGIKKPSKWYPIRFNQWVQYCENRGQLKYLAEQIQNRKVDVIELDSDFKHLASGVQSIKQATREEKRIRRGY